MKEIVRTGGREGGREGARTGLLAHMDVPCTDGLKTTARASGS